MSTILMIQHAISEYLFFILTKLKEKYMGELKIQSVIGY